MNINLSSDRTPMLQRKSITSRKSSTMSSISDMEPLSPKESLPSSPKNVSKSKSASVNEASPPEELSDTPDIGLMLSSEIGTYKTALSRTETVPLKTTASLSSSSLRSDSSSTESESIEDIPFAKKSSRASSVSTGPSINSKTSIVTVESTNGTSLHQETATLSSKDVSSSNIVPEKLSSTPTNILDILETIKLDNATSITKTDSVNPELSPTNNATVSTTIMTKHNESANDTARNNFFASLKEPVTPEPIPPLSPSLKVSTKRVETDFSPTISDHFSTMQLKEKEANAPNNEPTNAYVFEGGNEDNPDTTGLTEDVVNLRPSVTNTSKQFNDTNIVVKSQQESESSIQPSADSKNEGSQLSFMNTNTKWLVK